MSLESTEIISHKNLHTPNENKGQPTILVLDNDEALSNFLKKNLELKDYSVEIALTEQTAIEKIKNQHFDLVISDINLPNMSCNDLLKLCQTKTKSTELIIITGDPDLQEAVNAVKQGAFDYLSKPINPKQLYERVHSAIKHKQELRTNKPTRTGMNSLYNGYSIVRTLGAGNMGVVLLVKKNSHYYAMKIMRRDNQTSQHHLKVKRFIREAEILSKINHHNITKIFEYGVSEEDNIPYIVMEFVPGRPLNHYMRFNNFTNEQIIHIIRQLSEALVMIHSCDILHRDIKPGNILISDNLDLKLTDFGIARIEGADVTLTHEVLGSPAYMSPEAFDTSIHTDYRSDIFSIGVIFYELLTGIKPFHGETIAEMMNAIKFKKPIEPLKINNSFPPYLQDIIAKMLAKKPDERFSKAEDIIIALDFENAKRQNKEGITQKLLRTLLLRKPTWE